MFATPAKSNRCRLLTLDCSLTVCLVGLCLQAWSGRTTSLLWRRAAILRASDGHCLDTTASPCRRRVARVCPGISSCPKPACSSLMSPSRTSSYEIKTYRCWFPFIFFYNDIEATDSLWHRPVSSQRPSRCHHGLMWHPHLFFDQPWPHGKTD